MSTPPCHTYPTKAKAIEGFCDEFPELCTVSNGVESVPSDVEKTILFDDNPNNDENDCDGGFDFDLACPTACGTPQTTVSATYRVVADAFGGGKECPYHDGFVMERTCPARPACTTPCAGDWGSWSGCPSCGTTSTSHSETRSWTTTSSLPPGYSYSPACPSPTQQKRDCPATPACTTPCAGDWGNWSGCPSCGTTSTSHSETRLWTTTSSLPPGYSYSSACPTQQKRDCPAREPCPADCSEGTWSYTCPTNCGYRGGNVTATLVNYTPAVGTGSCTTTKQQPCPAKPACPPCEYTAWRDYGDRGCNDYKQLQTRDVTNGPCIHTYNFPYIHNNSPIYRHVPCEPCEVGVVSEGVHNSNDNPRRVCRWDGGTRCFCTKYKVQNWGITKQGVNTSSCYWSNTIFTPTKVPNGEWEGCSGCSACPRGQLSIPAR